MCIVFHLGIGINTKITKAISSDAAVLSVLWLLDQCDGDYEFMTVMLMMGGCIGETYRVRSYLQRVGGTE